LKSREMLPSTPVSRQMSLPFTPDRLAGLTPLERNKVKSALAQLLLQAAGVPVERADDDGR